MAMPHAETRALSGWQVLVTRPAGLADSLCAALTAAGAQVLRAPLLAIEPLPETAADRAIARQLDRYDLVIVTSRHAVQHALPRLENFWPQWPRQPHWLAVGTATAAALAAHHLVAESPVDARSEGLLALPALADIAGHRVLLLTGEGGRGLLDSALAARGAVVTRLESYRRAANPQADRALEDFQQAVATGTAAQRAVLVTSGDALHNLLDRAPALFGKRAGASVLHLVVASDRIGALATAAGLAPVTVAAGADDDALLAALTRLAGKAGISREDRS